MSRAAYDAIEADNFSTVKNILESPAYYIAERERTPTPEDELKYAVGTLVHAMTLEGKNLLDLYAIEPEGMRRPSASGAMILTPEGKAWHKEQTKPILKGDAAAKIPKMAEAIIEHPDAAALLAACPLREHAVVGSMSGLSCKALLDGVGNDADGRRGFLDLKTTTEATEMAFAKKIDLLHYDLQNEWYARLLAIVEGLGYRPWSAWIVAETTAPYEVEVYYPSEAIIDSGAEKFELATERLKSCRASGVWPKRSGRARVIDFPQFIKIRKAA